MSSGFDALPIRLRLAGVSALLTFVILCAFALAIGSLTVHRLRADFDRDVLDTANALPLQLTITAEPLETIPTLAHLAPASDHEVIAIFTPSGELLASQPTNPPRFGPPSEEARNVDGYRVVSRVGLVEQRYTKRILGRVIIEYGRRLSDVESTVGRVELFLIVGVLAGTAFALLAGLAIARRAMAPIATLTTTAAEIARTRDPSLAIPESKADDEVAELARTLQGMLQELDAARSGVEASLTRQRRFVADASHELRTPLTSVLANLELLAESLDGEQGDAARSALRSSQRMRRLVADLLLLARTDSARVAARSPCDLAEIAVEAAAELGPVSADHEIDLDVKPAPVSGASDDLHRLVINLLQNALRHTPAGTRVRVSTSAAGDGWVRLVVEDDGPGVPAELVPTIFERFVRGAGDRGGSSGLGLAIVRAVAVAHGGSVALEQGEDGHGARFVVTLPELSDLDDDRQHHGASAEAVVDELG